MDEAFLNDLLECSVCLEQLDSTSKVLPCQHTFCKRCLEEIVHSHKELRCPECRVLVEIAVDDLPSNILLIRLLEGIKNNPRSSVRVTNTPLKKVETLLSGRCLPPRAPPVSDLPLRSSLISELPSRASLVSEFPTRAAVVSELPARVAVVSDQLRRRTQPDVLEQRTPSKQILQSSPCAKAIYTYEGKEPGDLPFKKGDVIILHKRIDQNWYHGEANGKIGFLPARYVQVMVPLPTHVPQCKALYDFSVANNDEKDCLTFKKGEVITVIRRVDDNWAEGKLADKIGIFPISFVEMNVAARSLMKLSVNTQPGPSRVAPPTPTVEASQDSTVTVTKSVTSNSNLPILDLLSSAATTPSPTSSSATSPSTLSSSSSSASLTTKAPITESSSSTPSVLMRTSSQRSTQEREKRHSLSSLSSSPSCPKTTSSHIPVTHRHSAEILSTSGGDVLAAPKVATSGTATARGGTGTNGLNSVSCSIVEESGPRIIRRHSHRETEENKPHVVPKAAAVVPLTGSSATSNTSPITVQSPSPTFYMALYNYRPQKEDELELKKGEMYIVSEKCQDGWFKGTSVLNGHSGVFPGNYVHFAKMPSIQTNPFHPSHTSIANVRTNKSQLPIAANSSSRCKPTPQNGSNPFLAAALSSGEKPLSSAVMSRPRPRGEARTSVAAGLLEWARSVTAVNNPPMRPHRGDASQEGEQLLAPSTAPPVDPPPTIDSSPWVSRLTTCSQFPPTPQANTAIIQPQTSMAASYPAPSIISQAPPDPGSFPTKISQSWHSTRPFAHVSQQPPSLAVASPPNVSLRAPAPPVGIRQPHSKSDKHKGRKDKSRESLMKRLTSKRKSRSPPVVDLSCDNPSFVDSPSTHAAVSPIPVAHARSDSCPADILSVSSSDQKSSQANSAATESQKPSSRLKQPSSAVRERFRCVVPYPPNSEYELELKVGDIVYVHKKREDGWFKGTLQRTGKTGLFPASFVDSY